MDAEHENEPLNSSSASSSNNSSSSNLLANLPMLPILHTQDHDNDGNEGDDDDIDDDEVLPERGRRQMSRMSSQQQGRRISASPSRVDNAAAAAAQSSGGGSQLSQGAPPHMSDSSVFVSPLLFNNNSTPPPSSSSSSSSPPSSSHNLQLYHHHHQQLQQQHHAEHPPRHDHHQHSPSPSSSHQQHAPLPPPPQSQPSSSSPAYVPPPQPPPAAPLEARQQQSSSIDASHVADTLDASAVEPGIERLDLQADFASTSRPTTLNQPIQQQQQQLPSNAVAQSGGSLVSLAGVAASFGELQHAPPSTLPLLLQDDEEDDDGEEPPKPPHSYASHFAHSYTHQQQPHYPSFGCGSGGAFAFDTALTNTGTSNGAITSTNMLGSGGNNNNENAGGSSTAGGGGGAGVGATSHHHHHVQQHHQLTDRLKMLYPNVNENETPLPRCWSPHDKCLSIGLSHNNLRVQYKGSGKQHNDAASVRTAHPIPPACGLYYFEVKIISKGKNGYMGIGLTAQQFRMNRLPGWDKNSFGYHGDDGNSFSSSGNGQSYGPTFTTGDIIGCCVNFVNNTCFYTKNGIDLGIAFRDLPTKLYPTVGLQTPGEQVDANFGQEPFKFDQIEDMMKQMRAVMKTSIYRFPMPAEQGDPTTLLHKMVSSYLVHNGYSQTAEAFARSTGQTFQEDITSIRNRQKILKLIMAGRMGQAIEHTLQSYPGLLENNKNLWFMLKCRQFVEMVNGSDIEYCPTNNNKSTNSITTQTQTTPPPNQTSVIQSTKSYQNGKSEVANTHNNAQTNVATTTTSTTTTNSAVINADNHPHQQDLKHSSDADDHCSNAGDANSKTCVNTDYLNDVEMETNVPQSNGNTCKNGNSNNYSNSLDVEEEMDIDLSPSSQKYSHGIERILEFGKELSQMGQQLEKENKMNDEDRQMLEDAFSLIAYSNPWASPLGWQLCPSKRETVCTALNSAILESMNYSRRPPLDVCVAHAAELLKMMAHASLGACAFVNIEDIFPQN